MTQLITHPHIALLVAVGEKTHLIDCETLSEGADLMRYWKVMVRERNPLLSIQNLHQI